MNSFSIFGTPLYDSRLESRSITAENPTGARGAGGQAAKGRKGRPGHPNLKAGETVTLAEMDGPGAIRHIWLTIANRKPVQLRNYILRMYWRDQGDPSVEAPLSDFFGVAHGRLRAFSSHFLTLAEGKGMNSYFVMPFSTRARITLTNEGEEDGSMLFYQIDYTLGDCVDADTPRFHAQFRRVPETTLYEDYVVLDGIRGRGRYLGAVIGIVDRYHACDAWWGEGEVKIYLDGDTGYPTICGTGTEDYAGTAWGMGAFHAPEFGAPLVESPYFSFYRFHGHDPVYFARELKVTLQQIGNDGSVDPLKPGDRAAMDPFIRAGQYRKDAPGGNFERVDDVCSTAFWYQTLPTAPFPAFPGRAVRSLNLPAEETAVTDAAAGPQRQEP
ncbi:MAG: DUF2961 domain-containing protein [Candidatus Hydrogenedentes bacterium]|nr:DUF2961 domain-containing protein [Candidatus Hydrogenedentota bacterium]